MIVPPEVHAELFRLVEADSGAEVTIDLASQTLTLPGGQAVTFPIDNFSKQCLLEGVDQLGYILKQEARIRAYEVSHPSTVRIVA